MPTLTKCLRRFLLKRNARCIERQIAEIDRENERLYDQAYVYATEAIPALQCELQEVRWALAALDSTPRRCPVISRRHSDIDEVIGLIGVIGFLAVVGMVAIDNFPFERYTSLALSASRPASP